MSDSFIPGVPKKLGWAFWLPFTMLFVGLGLGAFYLSWRSAMISRASVPSTCTVTSHDTSYNDEDRKSAYTPQVGLRHVVDGTTYTRVDDGPSTSESAKAAASLARFPIGSEVPCKYVAGRPEMVTVFFSQGQTPLGTIFIGIVAMIIPLIVFAFERARGRA